MTLLPNPLTTLYPIASDNDLESIISRGKSVNASIPVRMTAFQDDNLTQEDDLTPNIFAQNIYANKGSFTPTEVLSHAQLFPRGG